MNKLSLRRVLSALLAVLLLLAAGCGVSPPPESTPPAPTATPVPTPEPTPEAPAPSPEPEIPALKGFTMQGANDLDFTLQPKESHRLVPVFDPEDWTGEVTFTSSNPEYAAVDETGRVTNVNPSDTLQKVIITVSAGEHSIDCIVYCRGLPASPAPEDSPQPTPQPSAEPAPEPTAEPTADAYGIAAPRAGLYRADDLSALLEKEAGQRMASASMSKIVTALTALKYLSPDEVLTVGSEITLAQPGASTSFVSAGHRLTLQQLLMGMLLPSGCDASFTVAVHVARKVSGNDGLTDTEAVAYFAGLMNELAAELGATGSHFVNPDGWDHPDHYTTVRDMALFASHVLKNDILREIVATPEQYVVFVSGQNITWRNTNSLLHPDSPYYCPDAIGMKTGTTGNAGNCLLSVVQRNGVEYILVVAGSPTRNGRYEDTLALMKQIPQ